MTERFNKTPTLQHGAQSGSTSTPTGRFKSTVARLGAVRARASRVSVQVADPIIVDDSLTSGSLYYTACSKLVIFSFWSHKML